MEDVNSEELLNVCTKYESFKFILMSISGDIIGIFDHLQIKSKLHSLRYGHLVDYWNVRTCVSFVYKDFVTPNHEEILSYIAFDSLSWITIEEPIINILYKKFEPVINADRYIYFPNDCANRSPFILCRKWQNTDSVIIDKWYNIFTKCWEYDKKTNNDDAYYITLLELYYLLDTNNIKRIYYNNKIYENDFKKVAYDATDCEILTHIIVIEYY